MGQRRGDDDDNDSNRDDGSRITTPQVKFSFPSFSFFGFNYLILLPCPPRICVGG
jgi:hypothetical protein